MRKAYNKIAAGLREALAVARGEAKPERVTVYSWCKYCGNTTKTINGVCVLCDGEKGEPT